MALLYRRTVNSPLDQRTSSTETLLPGPREMGFASFPQSAVSSVNGYAVVSPIRDPLYNTIPNYSYQVSRYSIQPDGSVHSFQTSYKPPASTQLDYGSAYNRNVASYYSQPAPQLSAAQKVLNTNRVFQENTTGVFSNVRYDLVGNKEYISRSDPRHTSSMYADRYPTLYNQYQSGSINSSSLFVGALRQSVLNDRDEIGNSIFNFSAPPRVSFTFNSRGGGTITGTGISFR